MSEHYTGIETEDLISLWLWGNAVHVLDGQAMVNITEKMVENTWRTGGVRDVYADFNELTMEIVASALFGADAGSENMAQVGPAITQAFQFFTRRATSMFIGVCLHEQVLRSLLDISLCISLTSILSEFR